MQQTRCDHCGQVDDHPKVHYGDQGTWHHDCTPKPIKEAILAGAHSISAEHTAAVFQACEDGLRGDDLRAHILAQHEEA